MKKISLFVGIALLVLTPAAYATKFISASIVDKDHIMLYFKDGDVVFNEGSTIISGCALHTSCSDPKINNLVPYGTAMNTDNAAVAGNWKISSTDDSDFGGGGIAPSNVYRKSKLCGMAQKSWNTTLGDFNFDWAYEHTLFLKLPKSMGSGKSYTIHIPSDIHSDVTAETLTFDIFNSRSEAVKVNIVGYSTANSIKAADVYIWMGNGGARDYASFVGKKIYLYNIDTETSHEIGTLSLWKTSTGETRHGHQMIRSNVWKADFTGFNEVGNYRLAVEDIGCSDNFTISSSIYYEPFKVSTQGFYYMRIGEENESITPITRRPLYIPGKSPANCTVYITTMHPYHANWSSFVGGDKWDSPAAWASYRKAGNPTNPNAYGGHSDALDWDRHLGHVSIIYDMLLPYFLTNGVLSDDNLGITESGNGIPDIIDEARNEVDFWLRLRDGKGYSHGLTNPTSSNANPANTLYQAANTGVAAWANAANAAMLADCFRLSGHTDLMERYRDSAIVAYSYASSLSATDQMLARTQGVGDATMTGKDFKVTAAAFLYNLTGNTDYEDDLYENSRCKTSATSIRNEAGYNETYAVAGYLFTNRTVNYPTLYDNMKKAVIAEAKSKEANYSNSRPSRRSTDQDNGWYITAIHNQRSILAHAISEEGSADRQMFEDALILEADFSLGRNPMSMIHMTTATTGLGDKRSFENAYTSGWNDGVPGVHPGHTPYMNQYDWGGGPVRGCPTWMTSKNYPAAGNWPYGELYYNIRYVWAANEFTPQQTMRGKTALYGYLYGIRPITKPIASITSGTTVDKNTPVTLSYPTAGFTIYYTLDGSDPSASSTRYTEPIVITEDVTIKAIAIKEGISSSEIAVFEYTVHIVIVEECLDFDTYVVTKWNNTFMLNKQMLKEEGYVVTGCKWYKKDEEKDEEIEIGKDFSYSAGAKKTNILEVGAVYRFELETSSHGVLCSTEKSFTSTNAANLIVYPNPVPTGGTLYIETDEVDMAIEIYNQGGICVKKLTSTGNTTAITFDLPAGNYIVKIGTKETKIIVK